jgi:hypothetical protein
MKSIYDKINDNSIDYRSLSVNGRYGECDVNIIIPIRGRKSFIDPLLNSLNCADKNSMDIRITVVEHSVNPDMSFVESKYGVNYIHVRCGSDEPFNKCLAMNTGALFSLKSKWFLFHDLDLLVQTTFFQRLFQNIESKNAKAIQTFNKRRVLFCSEDTTEKIIGGKIAFDDLREGRYGIFDNGKVGAPGGSIMIDKDIFFRVGGYDPELWHSYSPEDLFFWDKVSIFTDVKICDNPINEVFHMYHPLQQNMNPEFRAMMLMYKVWSVQGEEEKIKLCNYKRDLIKDYGY